MGDKLMTIQELANYLGISVKEVRRMVWANEISYIDLNRGGRYLTVRFKPEHVKEFLEKSEVRAG